MGEWDKNEIGRNDDWNMGKRMNKLNSYRGTHFLSLSRTLESGVPIMSCILAIWSTSFEPGKRGWRLKETKYMYETI